MTMFQAGPMVTLMASDLGADVIKIEAIQRLDGWRGSGTGGGRPWENSGLFNWVNRGKRGITLNLTDPRGPALVRQLVATADAVVENFTPRVMGNFGLDYKSLRAITPDLVMLSMPGFGGTGSWRDYAVFAWTTEQMSTICHLTGYEDGGPMLTGTTCGDPLAGLMGAVALLSALHHRRLTGEGQHVDLSQVEACTSFMGDLLIEAQLTHADPGRHGNRSTTMAPHGIYPCRDDRWVAVACRDDEEWRALATAMGIIGTALPHPTTEARVAAAADSTPSSPAGRPTSLPRTSCTASRRWACRPARCSTAPTSGRPAPAGPRLLHPPGARRHRHQAPPRRAVPPGGHAAARGPPGALPRGVQPRGPLRPARGRRRRVRRAGARPRHRDRSARLLTADGAQRWWWSTAPWTWACPGPPPCRWVTAGACCCCCCSCWRCWTAALGGPGSKA